ncbi:thioredoxin family protein [Mycoplasma cottewii]|uniref:Thioredoxin n=1 Tax=Mycoplasma cottewii TaxID=51364 RepID=A0ABY5TW85_9MOLU|nr:thioredoxin family protein [Mycoplasma cottewii]UWD34948.1 thioredoxin family protein [Mycoplasma cottewii]
MAKMIKITSVEQFNEEIKQGKVLIDFNATWCGPCRMLMPLVHDLASKTEGVKFLDVDVDINREIAREYGVMSIPMLAVLEDGKLVNKHVGFASPEKLQDLIK